ncbi:GntR family transcriptional regulator [Martelella sp. HB161492]|uniref:GntR family transcriptional regulator n=1 Tax=Martelella sp. HB161492 TaxID=2720726 RepID=UPI0015914D16|nr:GntR family transcriptional regulator [Martelella sp. HB161492]
MTEDDADIREQSPPARRLVKRAGLHEQVAERLRRMVLSGDVDAQERLNEVALSEALNVSRTPLREAIKLLASEGLLELLPGRGARVRHYSAAEIFDMFEVIAALERHATERAVETMNAATANALEATHEAMHRAFQKGDSRGYFRANQKVHSLIVGAGASAELMAMHAAITQKARYGRSSTLTSEGRWQASLDEHDALMLAIRNRNAEAAGRAMLAHIRNTAKAVAAAETRTETGKAASRGRKGSTS